MARLWPVRRAARRVRRPARTWTRSAAPSRRRAVAPSRWRSSASRSSWLRRVRRDRLRGGQRSLRCDGLSRRTRDPRYWAWAREYVLLDRLFESTSSWTLPSHQYLVSAWSASCSKAGDPTSCRTNIDRPDLPATSGPSSQRGPDFAWTELTWLLHRAGVSWAYDASEGDDPTARWAR